MAGAAATAANLLWAAALQQNHTGGGGNLSCALSNTTADALFCSDGKEYMLFHSHTLKPGSPQFWINISICIVLVLFAGVFSGLTLGLLSYDPNTLKVIIEGGMPAQAKYARKVLPLVSHHHLLLVTLLLCNAGVNESLPLFLDDLVPSPMCVCAFVCGGRCGRHPLPRGETWLLCRLCVVSACLYVFLPLVGRVWQSI